jgi:hypothetical protein
MASSSKATIGEATASYEAWLGGQIQLVPEDLERKHKLMRSAPFTFLRATYYRWAQLWPQVKKTVRTAKEVLAVGDLHVENFGTWRDAEGRLIWGINDFDEASPLPYTSDLLRLAASAHLAVAAGSLEIAPQAATAAILAGYREGLEAGGRPFVLAEHRQFLRRHALAAMEHPADFWKKLAGLQGLAAELVPESAARALGRLLPEEELPRRYARRVAGVGSLGRQRFVAVADWRGGKIAREAKAVALSAVFWARKETGETRELMRAILGKAVRCPDPLFAVRRRWTVRRLAPDCTKIEIGELAEEKETARLFHAMGWETANVHLGSAAPPALLLDLVSRPDGWMDEAVEQVLALLQADWEDWRKISPAPPKKAPRKSGGRRNSPKSS